MKILLVEPNTASLAALTDTLESLGHNCTPTTDAEQAWAAYQKAPCQIVLSACSANDSIEICRRMKRHPGMEAPYFIIAAPADSGPSLTKALGADVDDFITVPVEHHQIAARLLVAQKSTSTQQALLRAQAQAAQNSKLAAIGQLAASVAHELNTPLGAVGLALESAQRKSHDQERVERKLCISLRAVRSMQTIVSQLLTYSNRGTTAEKRCELPQVIEDTLGLVEPNLRKDGVTIHTVITDTPPVAIPASELQQVLINLLTNARDAALMDESRGRTVSIKTESTPTKAVLSVSDQGPGIAPEIQAKLFEPFFTTKPVGSGTGLGLSVVKKLLNKYESTLEIESEAGLDTIFRVSIPLQLGG